MVRNHAPAAITATKAMMAKNRHSEDDRDRDADDGADKAALTDAFKDAAQAPMFNCVISARLQRNLQGLPESTIRHKNSRHHGSPSDLRQALPRPSRMRFFRGQAGTACQSQHPGIA